MFWASNANCVFQFQVDVPEKNEILHLELFTKTWPCCAALVSWFDNSCFAPQTHGCFCTLLWRNIKSSQVPNSQSLYLIKQQCQVFLMEYTAVIYSTCIFAPLFKLDMLTPLFFKMMHSIVFPFLQLAAKNSCSSSSCWPHSRHSIFVEVYRFWSIFIHWLAMPVRLRIRFHVSWDIIAMFLLHLLLHFFASKPFKPHNNTHIQISSNFKSHGFESFVCVWFARQGMEFSVRHLMGMRGDIPPHKKDTGHFINHHPGNLWINQLLMFLAE